MASFLFTPLALTLGTADNNTTLSIALGRTTCVSVTLTAAVSLNGLSATGGNIDGLVVLFSNVTGSAITMSFAYESLSATAANRFLTSSATSLNTVQYGSAWFRYSSATLRWQQIGRS